MDYLFTKNLDKHRDKLIENLLEGKIDTTSSKKAQEAKERLEELIEIISKIYAIKSLKNNS